MKNDKNNEINNDNNTFTYEIISYIFIFWLVGLLKKNSSKTLKFHVGQGMILSIFQFIILLLISIINDKEFSGMYYGFYNKIYNVTSFSRIILKFLTVLFIFITLFYVIFGIISVLKGKKRKLPIIGQLAFYY